MRYLTIAVAVGIVAAMASCRAEPPPQRVPVPQADGGPLRPHEPIRPVTPSADAPPPRHFDDVPLVSQRPPEQAAFVQAYQAVGRPRITLFVNRTLDGQIIEVQRREPALSVEHRREATGAVRLEDRRIETQRGPWHDDRRETVDRFEADGPAEYRETTQVFLRPGEYDEIAARAVDYHAMETIMADWLAANGQVHVISPMMARDRMTDEQIAELQAGRPKMLAEIARELETDVLVQVQARPTRQSPAGLEVRVIAEAISLQGGQSIGRAVVDIPPPLDKIQLNVYTRFLARKLMDDMAATWSAQ